MNNHEQTHKYNLALSRLDMNNIQSEMELLKSAGELLEKTASRSKLMAPFRAMTLALRMRKKAKEGMDAPWIFAIALAIACDLIDLLPIAGWIISWIFRPYLFVFLWGKGKWEVKLLRYILMLFDSIPFINIAPWTTIAVVNAYRRQHKKLEKADKKVKKTKQQILQQSPAYADGYYNSPAQKAA